MESFNAKSKAICRLQTVFSTETRVSMRIYLETIKFITYPDMCAKVAQWLKCSAAEPERGFFLLKSLTFQKLSNHVYKNMSLQQYCVTR